MFCSITFISMPLIRRHIWISDRSSIRILPWFIFSKTIFRNFRIIFIINFLLNTPVNCMLIRPEERWCFFFWGFGLIQKFSLLLLQGFESTRLIFLYLFFVGGSLAMVADNLTIQIMVSFTTIWDITRIRLVPYLGFSKLFAISRATPIFIKDLLGFQFSKHFFMIQFINMRFPNIFTFLPWIVYISFINFQNIILIGCFYIFWKIANSGEIGRTTLFKFRNMLFISLFLSIGRMLSKALISKRSIIIFFKNYFSLITAWSKCIYKLSLSIFLHWFLF